MPRWGPEPPVSLLEIRAVTKQYQGRWVLQGVDLDLEGGERLALVGPSGCGKSTLLNLLGGLDRPDAGSIRFAGEDLLALPPAGLARWRRANLGTVFQFFHLLPELTAQENVALPLHLLGVSHREAWTRAGDLLAQVDLTHRASAWPMELSGGEQQRVAVARALVARPRLLLADEPTGNLDSASGKGVLDLLTRLTQEAGTALVLVTHSDAAAALCTRVLPMQDGRLG